MRSNLSKITLAATFGLALALTFSCSGDSGGGNDRHVVKKEKISGVSQKGPFAMGATVTIYELDENMNVTGNPIIGKTTDDNGNFEIKIKNGKLASPYIIIEVNGSYANEVTGLPSTSAITLKSVANVSNKDRVNINVLTHLEHDKVLKLARSGAKFDDAKKEAQKQVLNALGISESGAKSSEDMAIFSNSPSDAALLLVSILLQGNRTTEDVANLLDAISGEIRENGTLSGSVKSVIESGLAGVDIEKVKENLRSLDSTVNVPDLDDFFKPKEQPSSSSVIPSSSSEELSVPSSSSELAVVPSSSSSVPVSSSSSTISSSSTQIVRGTPVTYRGDTYQTVVIGTQTWFQSNLNYAIDGSKCYGDDPANCAKYGRLYNWETAMSLCPYDWHLPNDAEWKILKDFAGVKLKAASGWNDDGNGTDDYGFSALPGGKYEMLGRNFEFQDVGYVGIWWSATENKEAGYANTLYISKGCSGCDAPMNIGNGTKTGLYSVRCLQGPAPVPSSSSSVPPSSSSSVPSSSSIVSSSSVQIVYGDSVWYEGEWYRTVVIDTQTWFQRNLNFVVAGSKCGNTGSLTDDNTSICETYGRLYDWETAKTVCPTGWHLPSNEEWSKLYRYVDGMSGTDTSYTSRSAGKYLKATSGWNTASNSYIFNLDTYGFAALPGGFGASGKFGSVGTNGYWWSSYIEYSSTNAYARSMSFNSDGAEANNRDKTDMLSVRCIKN